MTSADRELLALLGELTATNGIVDGIRRAQELAWACARAPRSSTVAPVLVEAIADHPDQLVSIAAIHGVSATIGAAPTALLADLLDDPRHYVNEHAAWALSARPPHPQAMRQLTDMVAHGGFRGMLAQRTLRGWSSGDPGSVRSVLLDSRAGTTDAGDARIVETLGLVPGRSAGRDVVGIALDAERPELVRRAAVRALEDRVDDGLATAALAELAEADDGLSADAILALLAHDRPDDFGRSRRHGLRIAQLYLYADLENALGRAGGGDSGGIATLLGLLSRTLVQHDDVTEVLSISRGSVTDAIASSLGGADGPERFEAVPFDDSDSLGPRSAWTRRIQIERGLRRILRSSQPDAIHLRLADVGTLAAATVARQLAIPVVFTAAPDPHSVLDSLDRQGQIDRSDFGDSDAGEHWWFRARMVEQLSAQADRIALLPRVGMREEFMRLLAFDVSENDSRCAVIPEGVHAGTVRRAVRDVQQAIDVRGGNDATDHTWPAGVDALMSAVCQQPSARHGLPLVLTVGRLHPSKGIDRVVRAWATADLSERANLVVIGGDLGHPSAEERDVLSSISEFTADGGRPGLILLGQRPHEEVARIVAVAARGASPVIGLGGVYVCGAPKEEFGLAIVEALAGGLPVVAPTRGGPAAYVREGESGVLVDTTSVDAIADGIGRALELATDRTAADRASARVLDELTIENMADSLVDLYHSAVTVTAGPRRS